jgi:dTDP-4-amino-4,6-dideoxygalactose transaminase
MSSPITAVPFVDLKSQHQPIQLKLEQAIREVMQQDDYVLGKALSEFEQAFARACGTSHGIGVASGTDAIALGLQACGIGAGDEVILPANTFVATLIGVLRAGATPILVDCDPATALIDLNAAERAISARTRAIIPVHLYGQMVSPHDLLNLANAHNLLIFEDAAQAHLAEREGYRAGSVGIAAAFSFYPSKNLGAFGDGGMLVTQEAIIAATMRSLRNYGAPRKYYHTDFGTNSRLDTLQAAVLNVKLPYLIAWNRDRYDIAQQYTTLLQPLQALGIEPISNASQAGHVYHLYVVRVTPNCRISRDTLQSELAALGIQTGIHYPTPCHLQPAFQHLGYQAGDFPQTETLSQEILSLPLYPGLTEAQVNYVVSAIQNLLCSTTQPIDLDWQSACNPFIPRIKHAS